MGIPASLIVTSDLASDCNELALPLRVARPSLGELRKGIVIDPVVFLSG